jgi:tetratricopeptide (TPR) repeat protein
LLPEQQAGLAQARSVNPKAYEAYLQGQSYLRRVTRGDLDRAQEYFELALQLDADYALAYHGLAAVWAGRRAVGFVGSAEGIAASRAALSQALALDPALPQRHLALANAHTWQDWNWEAAEPEYLRAIDVFPNDADARVFYARYLNIMKRHDEASVQFQHALELDPLSELVRAMYGASLVRARRYDEAIANARTILRTTPASSQALSQMSSAFHFQGKYDEALAVEREMMVARGDQQGAAAIERGYAEGGYRGAMRQLADTIAARPFGRGRVAGLYIRAGENDLALDALERSVDARDNAAAEIGVAGIYEALRDHPRFVALLRRMNLPI